MMKSVIVPLEFADLSREAHRVSGLEVHTRIHQSVLVLSVAYKRHPPADDKELELVFSIPAAAELSRLLQEAVREYLGEETE